MLNFVLFVIVPYLAVALAVVVGTYRYFDDRFSYSSLSSQFLENRHLFWGSVPWHYAILLILTAHLLALLFPRAWAGIIAAPARLYGLEVLGLALALLATAGLAILVLRRLRSARVATVTSVLDWVLLVALLAQVALGFYVALFYRWGADWYLYTAVPWLVSLAKLNPETQYVVALPWAVKLHFVGGFLIVGLFPFTRLVHLVAFPFWYLWRPYQVVIWNRRPSPGARSRAVPAAPAAPVGPVG
ncbi:MAG: respiratory nitrate reductase subunit gamma [Gemmatimonadetes bacterium]|nr:respiratory nitrate reductase subunit gamma [Gemmatimonadota bacterium]